MDESDFDLEKAYEPFKEKYGLPELDSLLQDFDIEKSIEKESSFLLRDIRRVIVEKIFGYLQLFETLVNPGGTSMFIFSILRNISEEDKLKIKTIYKQLSKLHLGVMKLDTIYKEDEEAKYIVRAFEEWSLIKEDIYPLFEKFEEKFEEDNGSKKGAYFG